MTEILSSQQYFDRRISEDTVFVLPGHHFIQTTGSISISTLLGSCVAACIRDRLSLSGGLNHFLLPEKAESMDDDQSSRYGVHAMEVLINDLLKQGSKKGNLEAKIFGGANIIRTSAMEAVGTQNGEFVKDYLRSEGIPILAEDLGGVCARRIYFFPRTGRVSVLRIVSSEIANVTRKEIQMRKVVVSKQKTGGVELF